MPFISTYNGRIILNYHNIRLNYAIAIEATPRFLTRKFYARVINCSVFVKTTKTAHQLRSNEVTVASINLADELIILLIFVNNIVVPYELYELYDWGKVPELYGTL